MTKVDVIQLLIVFIQLSRAFSSLFHSHVTEGGDELGKRKRILGTDAILTEALPSRSYRKVTDKKTGKTLKHKSSFDGRRAYSVTTGDRSPFHVTR